MRELDCFGQIRAWAVKSFALAMTWLQAATRLSYRHCEPNGASYTDTYTGEAIQRNL